MTQRPETHVWPLMQTCMPFSGPHNWFIAHVAARFGHAFRWLFEYDARSASSLDPTPSAAAFFAPSHSPFGLHVSPAGQTFSPLSGPHLPSCAHGGATQWYP